MPQLFATSIKDRLSKRPCDRLKNNARDQRHFPYLHKHFYTPTKDSQNLSYFYNSSSIFFFYVNHLWDFFLNSQIQ